MLPKTAWGQNRRSGDDRCMTGLPLKAEVWPRMSLQSPRLKLSDRSCRRSRRPLPSEVVAYVGVAVSRIEPQAAVEWERLIELVDLGTGVIDGRRNVNTSRLLGQPQRWWA